MIEGPRYISRPDPDYPGDELIEPRNTPARVLLWFALLSVFGLIIGIVMMIDGTVVLGALVATTCLSTSIGAWWLIGRHTQKVESVR